MTAPSAHPRPFRRLRRRLPAAAAVLLLATGAGGCVTVHGERALLPATGKADAERTVRHFVEATNVANGKLDPGPAGQVETGALALIDGAGLKARHVNHPAGNPGYQPLVFHDTRYLIPRQRGWPKWFVVDTAENRDASRWLLVFTRGGSHEAWRASYLNVVAPAELPVFATDGDGYAEPVGPTAQGLAVQPGQLGARYTDYLQHGEKGAALFAGGAWTSGLRQTRRTRYAPTPEVYTQFADEAADPAQYPPVALRLADGGALVFFTTHHLMRQTVAHGPVKVTDPQIAALLTGTPGKSVTLVDLAEQVVRVPPEATGGAANHQVTFLNRIEGTVSASGR
ncbi:MULTISPECIES: hypothetical protein [Streptomycetaceae]|uniref:DUF8094 domain-containing protein n=1 Tax=Streptantibioticus cattleyicolor (strain ATCC 35852 / DSM 46488 / JCM 4925 / NBRC 14057 / NRRL 8057) TaxID=1003195 RepID=F8K234_STREN|nr:MULTISPECIES: hypothetical protein [Streptomycetaceae]AEW93728.1 hypothetical protein SCATT_13570 [Streptantibioticus cattleyicolor NRRL 8057 = DSM 46488]MYS58420.1 hypothetical protein [Streptomyces sp. SID5468]CCB74077.1 Uncharacterized lipoprotein SAV_5923 [Streptantibioticus cattleyicolor NRRL 8057 = DSM 46488]